MTAAMVETPTYCCVMLDLAFDPESIPPNSSRSQRRQAHVIWATGAAHRAFDGPVAVKRPRKRGAA